MKYILYNGTTVCTCPAHVFESFAIDSLRFLAVHLVHFNEINSLIDRKNENRTYALNVSLEIEK